MYGLKKGGECSTNFRIVRGKTKLYLYSLPTIARVGVDHLTDRHDRRADLPGHVGAPDSPRRLH